ncbi:MAG: hypothetical protein ACOC83_09970 [Gemmatimonadota bacterium]
MAGAGESERTGRRDGSRESSSDVRRLLLGLLLMAGLLGSSLASVFLLGRPSEGAAVAPGVPALALSGAALVVAAAVIFYRTYRER